MLNIYRHVVMKTVLSKKTWYVDTYACLYLLKNVQFFSAGKLEVWVDHWVEVGRSLSIVERWEITVHCGTIGGHCPMLNGGRLLSIVEQSEITVQCGTIGNHCPMWNNRK